MSFDLNDLLRDWPHEPGQLKVRKILGDDGREKIQLRIDLGVIQMEMTGRPDGVEPHECESLLDYQRSRSEREKAKEGKFTLTPDEVGDLQAEGIQFYHRYIALFQLQDYRGVIRDTQRNLEMFDFVGEHAPSEEMAWSVEQFTPYVLMMNTRAKASMAIEREEFAEAVELIEKGIEKVREFYGTTGNPELEQQSPEIQFLTEWLDEVREKRPVTKLERMQREMDEAIRDEAYERAAELRDAITAMRAKR
ncbi:MAG: UvrB/UvrC motif-containing protein [Chthoniobacteraceae bacterium]